MCGAHSLGQAWEVLGVSSAQEGAEYFYSWAHGIFQFLLMGFFVGSLSC